MRQEVFERSREERWRQFAKMLDFLDEGAPAGGDFPRAYRLVCQDLALARDRNFGADLVDRLNELTLRGHHRLYGSRVREGSLLTFLVADFPRAVRAHARLFWVISLLFYGSGLLMYGLDRANPELVYSLMSGEQVVEFEEMYDPESEHYGTPRDSLGDFSAFAYYIRNNIGIAFRTFASGIVFGLGSLFFILFNGVFFGLVAAHIVHQGYAETFFPFVIGHGSFELTAIVLAGVAGVRLGGSLLAPGPYRRLHALRRAARSTVPLLYGMTAMLVIAAVIEAFWSSSQAISGSVKLAVGAAGWAGVALWLWGGGRRSGD